MAQRDYRVDLTSPAFPLLSKYFGRTVMARPREEPVTEEGTPQLYYGHNILPTKRGYDSIAYTQIVTAITPAEVLEDSITEIKGNAKSRLYLAWNTTGEIYVHKPGTTTWVKLAATVPATTTPAFDVTTVTTGIVNGISYIYYRGIACFVYDEATDTLTEVTLVGLSLADILGITSSSGYLIAYTDNALAWSSTIDPTDFVSSQITGAGGGAVADITGAIRFAFANNVGILIYSETNVVAATYTGNVRYPFKLREVDNSKGGISPSLVAYEANTTDQFVFTRAGLQSVSSSRATTSLAEVTDFFIKQEFEDFDETTLSFSVTKTPMIKKLTYISSRYLIISYGISTYTHALVYDTILQRMGKLKFTHSHCFEYASSDNETSAESIAFLKSDGSIHLVDVSDTIEPNGVILLGKFEFIRGRFIGLQEVEIEHVASNQSLAMYDFYSLDGKTTQQVAGYLAETAEGLRRYYFNTQAKEHSLLIKGAFKLNTVIIIHSLGGHR